MKATLLLAGICMSAILHAQYSVIGKVLDSNNQPLPGANIIIRDSYLGTISNLSGGFSFNRIPEGEYTLSASYIGYEEESIMISIPQNNEITFRLNRSAIMGEEAIITASRAGQQDPIAVSQVSNEEIKKQNLAQDIPWLLATTPSMVVSSDAGAGVGYTGFRIRGTDANRINITVNGIPLNDAESHGVFFVNMPDFAASTQSVQVQRGVGTSQNGAAAFGASINIQTLDINPEAYTEVSTSYGSFNTNKNSVSLGTGLLNDHFTLDARLSGIHSDGYIDRAFSDLKSYFVSAGWHNQKSLLKFNVFSGKEKTYQAWDGVPGYLLTSDRTYNGLGYYIDENGNEKFYDNQTDNYQQDHYQLHFSRELTQSLNLNASLHFTHGEGYYEEYKENQLLSDYRIFNSPSDTSDLIRQKWLDNDFYGFILSSTYKKNRINASIGGGWNNYEGDHFGKVIWSRFAGSVEKDHTWYSSNSDKKDFNIFSKLNYSVNQNINLYGDMQVRGISYSMQGEDDDHKNITQNHNFFFYNPKAGINYTDNKGQRLFFSFSVANREPNRDNFVDADSSQPVPTFETLFDYELGYLYNGQIFRAGANLYFMDYNNQLVLTGEINDVGSPVMSNVKDSYRTGIEFTSGFRKQNLFDWDFSLTLSSNKIRNFNIYVDNASYWDDPDNEPKQYIFRKKSSDISFSPDIVISSKFRYFITSKLSVDLISKYVGSQYTDNSASVERMLDPWFVNDLRFEFYLKPSKMKELAVNFCVANIFNTEYSSNAWVYRYFENGTEKSWDGFYPQAGINIMAGVRAKF